jgi:hypothetical protein
MAVPKKRKKLDETAKELKKKGSSSKHQRHAVKTEEALSRNTSKKIDTAFEIMDHIQEETSTHITSNEESTSGPMDSKKSRSTKERTGFRFHISLDAVMPEKKTDSRNRSPLPVNKSSILDIGLTIPFFWKMPIIGKIVQKVIRNMKTVKF